MIKKLDQILTEGWRECWKWLSVQLTALAGLVATAYETLPSIKEYIPEQSYHYGMIGMFILIILGRLKNQEKPDGNS